LSGTHLADTPIPNAYILDSVDDVVAWVFSRSDSDPHLFGDDAHRFESDLRGLLSAASDQGTFLEPRPDTIVRIWHKP